MISVSTIAYLYQSVAFFRYFYNGIIRKVTIDESKKNEAALQRFHKFLVDFVC